MPLNRQCRECGHVNKFGALYCEECKAQMQYKPKLESLSVEELKEKREKIRNKNFFLVMIGMQSFFFLVGLALLLSETIDLIVGMTIGWIAFISFVLVFSVGISGFFKEQNIDFYLKIKDKKLALRHEITFELLFGGKFKKILTLQVNY